MSAEQQQGRDGGLSRRQLLTRGAIAGGLVWAAPVIRTTAAYATTANGTERPCTDFFMVIINPDGSVLPQPGNLYTASVPVAIQHWFLDNPDVQVQFPAVPPLLTQAGAGAWAVLLPEVTGPNASGRQCRMVIGWSEKQHHYAEGYFDPNPPLAVEVGRRLIFPCPDLGHDNTGTGTDGGGTGSGTDNSHNRSDQTTVTTAAAATETDPTTVTTPAATPGAGTADAVAPDASVTTSGAPSATGTISSDGANPSGPLSSDGSPSPTVSSDGSPSTSTNHPPGSDRCINHVYLIYCCPR